MPALCLIFQIKYYAQNYAGIIRQTQPKIKEATLDPPLQIDKYKEITGFDVYAVKTFNDMYHVFKHVTT